MNRKLAAVIVACLCSSACNGAQASSLQVAPVLVEVTLPAAASSLRLRNFGTKPIAAQVRVYRWSQQNGRDHLVETRDVVASPPSAEIGADATQLIRIVRVSKQRLDAEESYRLLIDEVPERPSAGASGVNFAVRHSIPVFFAGAAVRSAPLVWSVEQQADRLTVTASNPGSRRVRVAALRVAGPRGETIAFGDGLAGYVLGGAMAQWSTKGKLGQAAAGSLVAISANTDNGPLQTTGTVRAPR